MLQISRTYPEIPIAMQWSQNSVGREGLTLPNLKDSFSVAVLQSLTRSGDRQIIRVGQDSAIDPNIFGQPIFDVDL